MASNKVDSTKDVSNLNVIFSPRTALGMLNERSFSFRQSEFPFDSVLPSSPSSHRQLYCGIDRVDSPFPFHKAGAGFRKHKRDVKKEAVEKLLSSFDIGSSVEYSKSSCENFGGPVSTLFADLDESDSPTVELHKLCSRHLSLIPHYVTEDEQTKGLPHKRGQTVICKVGPHFSERGRGYTRKQAKKNAAYKMFHRIQVYLKSRDRKDSENICDFDYDEDDGDSDPSSKLLEKLNDLNITPGHSSSNN